MRQVLIIFSIIISLVSCSKEKEMTTDFWGKGIGIVAERSIIDGDTIILCDYNKVKKYTLKEIPYSLIASNYSLVKLDNSNEKAFLSAQITPIAISQNYIAVYSYDYSPLKLFSRKDGKYIRDIGSRGQGPGEYDMVLYAQIDEDSNSIYLLSSQSNVILVYDINGTYLRSILLPASVESFWFSVKVLQKLDSSEKYDLRGARVLIGKANLGVCDLFINYRHVFFQDAMNINTNDIYSNQYDKSNPRNVVDCFCHYDLEGNRLIPKFAIKNLDEDYTIYEFPEYFVVETLISTYGHSEESIKSKKIIVDKKNLKGCMFEGIRMPSGLLMNYYTSMVYFRDGYFLLNVFGSTLDEQIKKMDRSILSIPEQKNLRDLEYMIHDGKEDCNIVVIGKLINNERDE